MTNGVGWGWAESRRVVAHSLVSPLGACMRRGRGRETEGGGSLTKSNLSFLKKHL